MSFSRSYLSHGMTHCLTPLRWVRVGADISNTATNLIQALKHFIQKVPEISIENLCPQCHGTGNSTCLQLGYMYTRSIVHHFLLFC